MEHVIVTRHGLGQAMPEFYGKKTRYLEEVLGPSLARQTTSHFLWLVLMDQRAPRDVCRRTREVVAAVPDGEVVIHDPVSGGRLLPDLSALIRSKRRQKGPLVITRIDDDDAVHPGFCEEVNRIAETMVGKERVKLPSLIKFSHGVFLAPDTGQCLDVDFPDVSIISTISREKPVYHPYRHSHVKLHRAVDKHGGVARTVASTEPMWLRSIRRDSEAPKGERNVDNYFERLVRKGSGLIERADRGDWPNLGASLGFDELFVERLQAIEREEEAEHVRLVRPEGPALKRMAIKNSLLDVYHRIATSEDLDPEKRQKYMVALTEAFYRF